MAQVLEIPMDNAIITPSNTIITSLCERIDDEDERLAFLSLATRCAYIWPVSEYPCGCLCLLPQGTYYHQ